MKRTKLKDRPMPDYTRNEERFNMISHIVGGGLGVIYLIICITISALHNNIAGVISSTIYGISVMSLFTVSSVYHGLHSCMGKRVMQVLDHCTIYFMIAGTYTPITMSAIRPEHPVLAWSMFGIVWGIASCAVVFTAIDLNKFKVLSMISYLTMGWCVVLTSKITFAILTPGGTAFLLLGGVAYMMGIVCYIIGMKKRYSHSVFHIFVDIGSLLHFLCIALYVL